MTAPYSDKSIPHRTVLVVDDDPGVLRLVSLILSDAGYHVISAHDGVEGLEYLSAVKTDLMLLDLRMPVMDGWHVLERLRATSSVPVAVITEFSSEDDRQRCTMLGAVDYIEKPFLSYALTERVARAIGGENTSASFAR